MYFLSMGSRKDFRTLFCLYTHYQQVLTLITCRKLSVQDYFRRFAFFVSALICVSQSDAQMGWSQKEHLPQSHSLHEVLQSDTRISSTTSSGEIAFYYVSGTQHGVWRASRNPNGSWDRGNRILLNGVFNGNAVDPDIVRLDDGRYRLYYFLGNFVPPFPSSNGLFSAISSDGINFTTEGQIINLTGIATDPTVVRLSNGNYLLAAARHVQSGTDIVLASSSDGRSFQTNGAVLNNAGIPELTVLADGSVRLFYNGPGGIVSRRSTDGGSTWQLESGVRLSSQAFLGDPSVVKRSDGSWVMFVKGFNNTGLPNPTGHNVRMAESQDGFTFSLSGGVLLDSASVPEGVILPPTAPTLVAPSDGATGVATNPTLSWNASTGATSYRLQVSTSSTFSTTVYDRSGITGTSQQVAGLANNTLYYWRVNATNAGGTSSYSSTWSFTTTGATSVKQVGSEIPTTYALYQNYPNPFNPSTTIRFSLPYRSHITLKVFDLLGREVASLANEELDFGEHSIMFSGNELSSGVYFYRLTTPTFSQTKQLQIVR